jgi:hypothetical protein
MRRWRVLPIGLALVAPALTLSGATAVGTAITVGQTAPTPPTLGCLGQRVWTQGTEGPGPSYVTTTGVITSWSVMAGTFTGPLTMKIVRQTSPSTFLVTGVGRTEKPTAGLDTFPDRIPVSAGDRLALYLPTDTPATTFSSCVFAGDAADQAVSSTAVADPGVGSPLSIAGSQVGYRLNVSATIEPDADGDGYGDLSQDLCPTRATQTTECVPPDTTLTAPTTVRTSARKAKVKVLFLATEPATFTCSVDGGRVAPCTSPAKVRLRLGKHRLVVTAIDAAGNPDPTPASVTVKVKKKVNRTRSS